MRKRWMYITARVILGLGFLFSGIMKFVPIESPELPVAALNFMNALVATGYFIPLIGIIEIVAGLLLLANYWVPFSMMLLSPIVVNILLLTVFLVPSLPGFITIFLIIALQSYIVYYTWSHYKSLFSKVK